jgi:hypothetical protein
VIDSLADKMFLPEAEVLEGLNLDRMRPWIIVIEATEPISACAARNQSGRLVTIGARDRWEHL